MSTMFLYELAIELGEHSNDLVEVATMLGVAGAGPATQLDAQQVAQLRAHFGGVATGPPPPPLGASGHAVGTGPVAPPSWGPPGTPSFQAVPGPPLGSPHPGAPGPAAATGVPIDDENRWSKGQVAAIAGVAVVVLGLFGFMVFNTGPDEQRQDALDAREQELAAATTEWVPPPEVSTTTGAPPVTAAPMPRAVPGGLSSDVEVEIDPENLPPPPGDQTRFCSGMRAIMGLEVGVGDAALVQDLDRMKTELAANRNDWAVGLDHLLAGASDRDRPLLEEYRDRYQAMFEMVEKSATYDEFGAQYQARFGSGVAGATAPVNETASAYCA